MSDLRELYQEVILDHHKRPRNFRKLETANRQAEGYNPLCGDKVSLYLKVENGILRDIGFQGSGCAISTASASMMTEIVKGQTLHDADAAAKGFTERMASREPPPQELEQDVDALQGVKKYPARVKCALLPWTTLRESVDLYRHREPARVAGADDQFDCADAP